MIALRIARRRTTWETSPIDELIKAEFAIGGEVELNLSVYEIQTSDIVRAVTEHTASFQSTPRSFPNLDMTGPALLATPGETEFEFTRTSHREMRFDSVDELKGHVSKLLPELSRRVYEVSKAQAKEYAHARRDANDPEWVAFFGRVTKWPT